MWGIEGYTGTELDFAVNRRSYGWGQCSPLSCMSATIRTIHWDQHYTIHPNNYVIIIVISKFYFGLKIIGGVLFRP